MADAGPGQYPLFFMERLLSLESSDDVPASSPMEAQIGGASADLLPAGATPRQTPEFISPGRSILSSASVTTASRFILALLVSPNFVIILTSPHGGEPTVSVYEGFPDSARRLSSIALSPSGEWLSIVCLDSSVYTLAIDGAPSTNPTPGEASRPDGGTVRLTSVGLLLHDHRAPAASSDTGLLAGRPRSGTLKQTFLGGQDSLLQGIEQFLPSVKSIIYSSIDPGQAAAVTAPPLRYSCPLEQVPSAPAQYPWRAGAYNLIFQLPASAGGGSPMCSAWWTSSRGADYLLLGSESHLYIIDLASREVVQSYPLDRHPISIEVVSLESSNMTVAIIQTISKEYWKHLQLGHLPRSLFLYSSSSLPPSSVAIRLIMTNNRTSALRYLRDIYDARSLFDSEEANMRLRSLTLKSPSREEMTRLSLILVHLHIDNILAIVAGDASANDRLSPEMSPIDGSTGDSRSRSSSMSLGLGDIVSAEFRAGDFASFPARSFPAILDLKNLLISLCRPHGDTVASDASLIDSSETSFLVFFNMLFDLGWIDLLFEVALACGIIPRLLALLSDAVERPVLHPEVSRSIHNPTIPPPFTTQRSSYYQGAILQSRHIRFLLTHDNKLELMNQHALYPLMSPLDLGRARLLGEYCTALRASLAAAGPNIAGSASLPSQLEVVSLSLRVLALCLSLRRAALRRRGGSFTQTEAPAAMSAAWQPVDRALFAQLLTVANACPRTDEFLSFEAAVHKRFAEDVPLLVHAEQTADSTLAGAFGLVGEIVTYLLGLEEASLALNVLFVMLSIPFDSPRLLFEALTSAFMTHLSLCRTPESSGRLFIEYTRLLFQKFETTTAAAVTPASRAVCLQAFCLLLCMLFMHWRSLDVASTPVLDAIVRQLLELAESPDAPGLFAPLLTALLSLFLLSTPQDFESALGSLLPNPDTRRLCVDACRAYCQRAAPGTLVRVGRFAFAHQRQEQGETRLASVEGKRIFGQQIFESILVHLGRTADCPRFILFNPALAAGGDPGPSHAGTLSPLHSPTGAPGSGDLMVLFSCGHHVPQGHLRSVALPGLEYRLSMLTGARSPGPHTPSSMGPVTGPAAFAAALVDPLHRLAAVPHSTVLAVADSDVSIASEALSEWPVPGVRPGGLAGLGGRAGIGGPFSVHSACPACIGASLANVKLRG
ncbi:hypothetical protein H696_00371 [Fonticula alba]|uniref:Uncharacterized protein n=1 Tax=Fonticula alba TaxID=691883 RepID=A0A058ZH32_FONAL|nr:hypothetical protein H696_00371 [Fonticula alba]KCV72792.1 hypothetical protein H696_00371 [Fonticula alba]|eukprot:XP_009492493.1 hypothetical protein H696_00371 [Fonticula alba]